MTEIERKVDDYKQYAKTLSMDNLKKELDTLGSQFISYTLKFGKKKFSQFDWKDLYEYDLIKYKMCVVDDLIHNNKETEHED